MWDFGSAARHHELYNPWLGDGPLARRNLDAARRDVAGRRPGGERRRARSASSWSSAACSASPLGVDAIEPAVLFALQAAGIEVVDGQQLMQNARVIKTRDEITLLNTACMHGRRRLRRALPSACGPACARTTASRSSTRCSTSMGSEFVEGVNAISGERCSPHPHVFTDRALRPGDPAYFDILHSYLGYRTCYYRTFAVGSASRAARRRLQALPLLPRRGDRADPARARRPRDVVAVWPKAAGVRLPRRGGGVRAAVRPRRRAHDLGEADLQPPRLARPPRGDPGGHGVRARDVLAGDRRLVGRAHRGAAGRDRRTGCEVITRFPAEDLLVAGKPLYTTGGELPRDREVTSDQNTRLDSVAQEAVPNGAGPGNGRVVGDACASALG